MKYIEDSVRTPARKCISFENRKNEYNYIKFVNGVGCKSYVGKINKSPQEITISKTGCLLKEIIVHEVLHSLGKCKI